ncbi:MAG: tetratricopeptide repeat protein [Myxococcota bacterium]
MPLRGRLLLAGILVLTGLFAVYGQVRNHTFVGYDDNLYITENAVVREGLGLSSAIRAFSEPHETNWIPLTWISLQLDHSLYGLEPAGYLLTNVFLHAASALLLFLAFARMTGAPWPSGFVAAVFALHPLHVESVAWASERKDALSGVFWMLTLLAYAQYAKHPGSLRRYALALACLVLGLLAKPMLVTLPFVLLLLDYWPLGRWGLSREPGEPTADGRGQLPKRLRTLGVEKLPMLAIVAAVSVVTFLVQRETGAMSPKPMLPFPFRLQNAVDSYGIYILKSVWPTDLAVFYPHPLRSGSWLRSGAIAVGLASVTAIAARAALGRPYLIVGWLWYLGTLVPVIGLVQAGMQARADRYMYVPLIGLSVMLAWGAADLFQRRRHARTALAAAACIVLMALAATAQRQVAYWRDTASLFERALAVTKENFVAHRRLATALLSAGSHDRAKHHFAAAVQIQPRWFDARVGLGDAHLAGGETAEAIDAYTLALRLQPDEPRALVRLGRAHFEAGEVNRGERTLLRALRLQGEAAPASLHAYLGRVLLDRGALTRSAAHFRSALERDPDFSGAHAQLGLVLMRSGREDEARFHLKKALALGMDGADVHAALATLAMRIRDDETAARHYREALRLDPGMRGVGNNLAWLLATSASEFLRDPQEAIRIVEAMLESRDSESAAWLDTLAAGYAAAGRFEDAIRTVNDAIELWPAAGGDTDDAQDARKQVEARLTLYRAHRPYVAPR